MKKHLVTIPNKTLSEVTTKVTSFDNDLENQVKLMRKFLKTHDGAGLAANQIGIGNRVLVVEFLEDEKNCIPFQEIINPEVVELNLEKETLDEGCLSVPKIELPVERSTKIKIRYQNIKGKSQKLTAKDIFARILQHEIDHLNGIIFTQKIKEKLFKDCPDLKNLKIVFFGSGKFATTILEGLIVLGFKLKVFTESAKPAGRDKTLKPTPVTQMAKEFEVEANEINNLADEGSLNKISSFNPDLIICADFGKIIPENVLQMAKIAAVNLHPSLLPKYRGPSPIQSAILAGDKETGVSIIKMTNIIDEGPILGQVKTEILPSDNTFTLSERLSTLALKLLFQALPLLAKNQLQETNQDSKKATQTRKFQKSDGEINWQKPIEEIDRQIHAFYPWPGSYTILPNGKRLLIHLGHLVGGGVVLDMVQMEGGKPVKWEEFLRGYHGPKPDWFDKIK